MVGESCAVLTADMPNLSGASVPLTSVPMRPMGPDTNNACFGILRALHTASFAGTPGSPAFAGNLNAA